MLASLVALAVGFWGMPACGYPQASVARLTAGNAALADVSGGCSFAVDERIWKAREDLPLYTCGIVIHEVGHLRLGPAFAASNPSDPYHALSGVMSAYGGEPPVCQRWYAGVLRARHARARRS